MKNNLKLEVIHDGDYVLATKYHDGDPMDQWAVGFFDSMLPKSGRDRYMVIDSEGNQFRGNGFRRVKKIDADTGKWLLKHASQIQLSDRSLWEWLDYITQQETEK